MLDYRKLKVGDNAKFETHEFDGDSLIFGTITSVYPDHAIMTDPDDINYWIDDDTAFQFSRR